MSGCAGVEVVCGRLKATLGDAAGVYDTIADLTDPGGFKARYVVNGVLHAYEVTRDSSRPVEGRDTSAIQRTESIVIYGYMAYDKSGASEPVFQAEIDRIVAAFDPPKLRQFLDQEPQTTSNIDWSEAPTVEGPRVGKFGQYTIHYARITVPITFGPIF